MVEPIGSLMVAQAQSYNKNYSSFEYTANTNNENLESVINIQTAQKLNTVSSASEGSLNKDKNNEGSVFQQASKETILSEKDKKKIKENIDKLNKQIKNTSVKFSVHEKSNRIAIKVIDKNTDKIIREIPPEKLLDAYADRMELLGLTFDASK